MTELERDSIDRKILTSAACITFNPLSNRKLISEEIIESHQGQKYFCYDSRALAIDSDEIKIICLYYLMIDRSGYCTIDQDLDSANPRNEHQVQ